MQHEADDHALDPTAPARENVVTTHPRDAVRVRGARENNLRDVDVDIPRNTLVAFTGVSGSGKSSLAFGTLYAESQRRYFESVAPYARRLIDQVGVPEVDSIEGLPPAVALQQQRTGGSARSTVASATTLGDVVRMFYSRVGTYPDDAPPLLAEDFSTNTVHGACPACHGLGRVYEVPEHRMVPDDSLTIREGAIASWPRAWHGTQMRDSLVSLGYDIDVPWRELPAEARNWILHTEETPQVPVYAKRPPEEARRALAAGEKPSYMSTFVGAKQLVLDTFANSKSAKNRERAAGFMTSVDCPACAGRRLKSAALAVTVAGLDITEFSALPLDALVPLLTDHLAAVEASRALPPEKIKATHSLVREMLDRLRPLVDLGLGHLSLDRTVPTLSTGELQRMRLATQVLSQLFGVVFVLDEPSAGLHPADMEALLRILHTLRDTGNSVFVVEHALDIVRRADWIVDIGPAAGAHGGTVLYSGPPAGLAGIEESSTRRYLFPDGATADAGADPAAEAPSTPGIPAVPGPTDRRGGDGVLELRELARHNLRGIDLDLPLGTFTAVTGVSGSGKSTLVNEALPELLRRGFSDTDSDGGPVDHATATGGARGESASAAEDTDPDEARGQDGAPSLLQPAVEPTRGSVRAPRERVRRVVRIDQKPIGRTPRSNVATYTGVFDRIRTLFAATPEARKRRYNAGRFSFNKPAGRCPTCKGEGEMEVELLFLPTVHAPCSDCGGTRYAPETLEVRLEGRSIAEVLAMSVTSALDFFTTEAPDAEAARHLRALVDVGLGYVALGQPAPELSGGEAQRVKLASELHRPRKGDTLYLLDEPSSGLHPADTDRLVGHLQHLVDGGNTVVLAEHDMRVVAAADHVVDLGPGAGAGGGTVVVTGTPEEVAASGPRTGSVTAPFLAAALGDSPIPTTR
ncbi:excinuclease ABC subunit UvrA [Brevibacterium litoralis]|uniref:excinuclease ABC subunit UvrA n=1 Tax=Brevibacterium litoralis TaxID=3138935 RepID=UPI0032EEADC3